MSKQCRVITSCFNNGRIETNNSPPDEDAVFRFFNRVIQAERKLKSDIEYDVIVINHDTKHRQGNKYIEDLNNKTTDHGIIKTFTTELKPSSFDGFNTAFKMHSHIYDYWIFTEDDHILYRDNYYHDLLREYKKTFPDNMGALTLAPISNWGIPTQIHSGGGFCVFSTQMLTKITLFNSGSLRNVDDPECHGNKTDMERKFTNDVVRLGYELKTAQSLSIYPHNAKYTQHLHHINTRGRPNNPNPPDSGKYFYQVGIDRDGGEKW